MSYSFDTGKELVEICEREGITIAEATIRHEMEKSDAVTMISSTKCSKT